MENEPVRSDADEQSSESDKGGAILIGGLLLALVLLFVGLGFAWFGRPAEDVESGWPRNIEENVAGVWVATDSDFGIAFESDGGYQILNYQGRTILGDWSVDDNGLIEVPVSYRNYSGVWYFVPAGKDTLTLEVEELDLSETLKKDH